MKTNNTKLLLVLCIFVPLYVIGFMALIFDYFLPRISGDMAKNILGALLFVIIVSSLKFLDKVIKFN